MRREFPRKVMSVAFDRCGGHCERCTAKLFPGKFAYDHILPDALGGEPTLANCQVLCTACHSEKTGKVDVPMIRKGDRVRDKHNGATLRGPNRLGNGNNQHRATGPIRRRNSITHNAEHEDQSR